MATHVYNITIDNPNFKLTDGCIIYTYFNTTIDSTVTPVFTINGGTKQYPFYYLDFTNLLPGYTIEKSSTVELLYYEDGFTIINGVFEPKLKYGVFTTETDDSSTTKILSASSGFTDISQLASGESMIAYVIFLNGNTADQYTFQFPNVTKTISLTQYAYTSKQYSGYIDPIQTVSFLITYTVSHYNIHVIGGAHNFKTTKYNNYRAKVSAISTPKPN